MLKQRQWALAYLIIFGLMIFLNYWSTTNVGIVADNNEAIIQPAGFAFSIWGLIYALLFAWVVKQFFVSTWEGSLAARLTFWPILNFLLNGLWIVVFTQQWLIASGFVIVALLYTIAVMYAKTTKAGYNWFDRFPLSIYLAWVTLATIVNVFTVMVNSNVETFLGLNELAWTLIMLVAATAIGIAIAWQFSDWLYPLVLLWPYYGIYVVNDRTYNSLDITLLAASITLVVAAIIVIIQKFRYHQSH